ncbi:MAG: anti sigma factor C-terminal domain-containing protein [Bacillota bacterium]|nr:anti sigma factor C-terminal domain-containing protein [Bacillota bacterium]
MTYREKLELYSQGKLDEQQRIEVEKELEKQEALSDYLFEHEMPPGMEDFSDGESPFGVSEDGEIAETGDNSEAITKQINRSIRKAFIKTGVIAAAVAIVLTLFVVFALPHIVSAFYYDPGKSIGVSNDGSETEIEQLERDMSVYSEMFMPEMGPAITAGTDSYGYGEYSYYLDARFAAGPDGNRDTVTHVWTGNIKRNNFTCYNYGDFGTYNKYTGYFSLEDEEDLNTLDRMRPTELYYTYVTLDREMPYEEFYADYVENDDYGTNASWVWCGVRVSEEENAEDDEGFWNPYNNAGFYASANRDFAEYSYDTDKYPKLAWEKRSGKLKTEKKASVHFQSMIRYLSDNGKFSSLDNDLHVSSDLELMDGSLEYIKKNGIDVYGFIYVTDKTHAESIAKEKGIKRVEVRELD